MKAWVTFLKYEQDNECDLVHADTRTEAKRKSIFASEVDNWVLDIGVRREPKLDDIPLTDANICAAGYSVECSLCGGMTYQDLGDGDDGNVLCEDCSNGERRGD